MDDGFANEVCEYCHIGKHDECYGDAYKEEYNEICACSCWRGLMQGSYVSNHWCDSNGNPEGGQTHGVGFAISWQRGPLGRVNTSERIEPNGAFVETIIAAAIDRIIFYQMASDGRFACDENAQALVKLNEALDILNERTARRVAQQVEGTHEGN